MANTKAQKLDLEVEKALEQALDIDFGDDIDLDMDLGALDEDFSVDDLEEQISRAAEELQAEQKTKPAEAAQSGAQKTPVAQETHNKVSSAAAASAVVAPAAPPVPPVVKAGAPVPPPAARQPVAPKLQTPEPQAPNLQEWRGSLATAQGVRTPETPEASEAIVRPPASTASPAAPARRPANDDARGDRAAVLAPGLRRASDRSSKLYWTTTAISVLWAAGGIALSRAIDPNAFSSLQATKNFVTSPAGIGLAAGIVLPIAMFWGFTQLVRRAREMQIAARTMSDAALRLLQPEAVAGDRVSTLSQAVRREVAAMNEGIERTLARAVELETLVQTEVNQLERAYSDNEIRIRSLVSELGNEREAVVSHAERVRSSISGAHEQLKEELSSASSIISDNVLSASQQLSTLLNQSGERLIGSINESGGAIAEAIGMRTGDIGARITASGETFAGLLDTRIAALDEQSRSVFERLKEALDDRTTGIADLLGGATESMVSEFDTRLANLNGTLSERGQALLTEFEARAHALDSSTEKLNIALESRSRQINENLIARTREIAETFSTSRASLSAMIDETKSKIGAELSAIGDGVGDVLSEKAAAFSVKLAESRDMLAASLESETGRVSDIIRGHADTLASRADAIHGAVETSASILNSAADNHAAILSERTEALSRMLDERAQAMGQSLETGRSAFDVALEEHVRHVTQRTDGLAATLSDNTASLNQSLQAHNDTLAQRAADLREEAGQVVDPLQGERADREIERAGLERKPFAARLRQPVDMPDRADLRALGEPLGQQSRRRAEIGGALESAIDGGKAVDEVVRGPRKGKIRARNGQPPRSLAAQRQKTAVENGRRAAHRHSPRHNSYMGAPAARVKGASVRN